MSIDVRSVLCNDKCVRFVRWVNAPLKTLLMGLLSRTRVARLLEVGFVKVRPVREEMLLW